MEVDAESPEWTIAWTLRKQAKTLSDKKLDMTAHVAKEITVALQRSNWRLIRIPPELPAPGGTDPARDAVLQRRREEREAFENLLDAVMRAWSSRR